MPENTSPDPSAPYIDLQPAPGRGRCRPSGGDDAVYAGWIPARTYDDLTRAITDLYGPEGQVFAAHVAMLQDFLEAGQHR